MAEGARAAAMAGTTSSNSMTTLARRPGFGTAGKPTKVLSNNFLVRFNKNIAIFHYDVSVTPDVPVRFKREIIRAMVEQNKGRFSGPPVYDGDNSLYVTRELGDGPVELDVLLGDVDEDGLRRRNISFKITLREASRPNLSLLHDYLKGATNVLPQETIQVLDLVLRECATNAKALVAGGRSFYSNVLGSKDLGGGIVAWQGFYMSIRPAQNGYLVLNMDMTGNAFIKENQTVVEFIGNCFRSDPRDIDYSMKRQDAQSDAQRAKMSKLLKGMKVETSHGKSKRRLKIVKLTRQPLQSLTFTKDGLEISVVDYFRQAYGINLQYLGFPVAEQGSGERKKYVPLELCRILRGQNFTRKINDQQVNGLASMTCCLPEKRIEATKTACLQLKDQSRDYASQFGVQINSNMTEVEARVLLPPKVQYGNGEISPRDGGWNMISKRMVEGREIKHWAIASFSNRVRENDLQKIAHELSSACYLYGVGLNKETALPPLMANNPQRAEQMIRSSVKQLAEQNIELQLVFCVLPDHDNKPYYVAIKRLCELELGVITQCVKDDKVKRCDPRYLANVVLKINAKFGGTNAVISVQDQRKCRLIADSPTLILGADVSHPRAADDAACSMAAVVASMDWPGFAQYATVVRSQSPRQEMVDDLFWEKADEQGRKVTGGIFKEMLMMFYNRTHHVPQRIIYYRDGVSEGQFEAVLKSEYESLQRACDALGWMGASDPAEPAPKRTKAPQGPKITFIVVQKRHHTCFFPTQKPTGKFQNVQPGTIVDKVVCHPSNFDFYLCSHQGIKGTSRPVHYHVLKDENGFGADEIQQFTHDMCYLYSRCTRAVSVVPPCYYAHLAAQRAQTWVDPEGSSMGSDPTRSVGSGGAGGSEPRRTRRGPSGPVRPLPPMHDNIKNTMFYI